MINNNLANHLNRFFNKGAQKNEAGGASDTKGKGKNDAADPAANDAAQAQAASKKKRPNYVDQFTRSKEGRPSAAAEEKDAAELSPEEKRKAAIQKIMDKLDAEEAARYPNRVKEKEAAKTESTEANSEVITTTDPSQVKDKEGIGALLNDLPLFNEFKTSLMDAFRSMDSASYGSISAQYELNYSSMQYIADAAGNYKYEETSFNLKLDLNYVKAGAGGMSGADMADALGKADDFESFVATLQGFAGAGKTAEGGEAAAASESSDLLSQYTDENGKPLTATQLMNNAFKNYSAGDVLKGLQDYFSPEKTSGRIVDFATAFFPMSDAYKKGGDTEESRKEFGEMMRKAIQKGFDQAMGALGKVPDATQQGIDKTHELTMKGIDDFIKNGMKQEKQPVYDALQEFSMSFEMNYSKKTVSVSGYGSKGETQTAPTSSTLNTEA